jgi:hypothetical protein
VQELASTTTDGQRGAGRLLRRTPVAGQCRGRTLGHGPLGVGPHRLHESVGVDVHRAREQVHRGPGEPVADRRRGQLRVQLKNWRVLRKIRSSPNTAERLIAAVQTLMIASA